jgi:hypothetical protein
MSPVPVICREICPQSAKELKNVGERNLIQILNYTAVVFGAGIVFQGTFELQSHRIKERQGDSER